MRLGAQPPADKLFNNTNLTGSEEWNGIQRTEAELTTLKEALRRAVEEIGGKVSLDSDRVCIVFRPL